MASSILPLQSNEEMFVSDLYVVPIYITDRRENSMMRSRYLRWSVT